MDAAARKKIVEVYRRFLRKHGPTVRAVDWVSEEVQRLRFQALEEVGSWDGVSVADIGCGLGDFFAFLVDRGHAIRYTGYDITPEMVEAAKARYPDPAARFEVRDILDEGDDDAGALSPPFDYVVASGTFNIRTEGHDDFLRRMLAAMYRGCRRAVAFNVLKPVPPSHPDHEFNKLFYGDFYYDIPSEDLIAFCRTLSNRVVLHRDDLSTDSTVFIYRE
jgi:SAM-dependent methyltransferase